jgi:hypothetical protein
MVYNQIISYLTIYLFFKFKYFNLYFKYLERKLELNFSGKCSIINVNNFLFRYNYKK